MPSSEDYEALLQDCSQDRVLDGEFLGNEIIFYFFSPSKMMVYKMLSTFSPSVKP